MDGEKARRVLFADNPLPTSCVIRNSNFSLWLDDEAREWKNEKGGGGGEEEDKKTWVNAWSSLCIRLASAEDAADYRYLLLTAVKAIVLETWLSTKEALQSFLRPSCDLMEPFVFSLKFLFLPAYRCIFFISFDSKKKSKTKGKFRRIVRCDRKIIIFIY